MVRGRYGCSLRCNVFFYSFVNGLIERYPELYEEGGVGSKHQLAFGKKWKGYQTLVEIAGGDLRYIDEISKYPLEKCLLYLSYRADKSVLETLLHKESLARMKH